MLKSEASIKVCVKHNLHDKVVFKPYHQHQLSVLLPSLDELIEANHLIWVVNSVIDSLNLSVLESSCLSGGTSNYHPKMLLEVIVYSYLQNIYSSRGMEEGLKWNIHLMWLSGRVALTII
jgi:transposase